MLARPDHSLYTTGADALVQAALDAGMQRCEDQVAWLRSWIAVCTVATRQWWNMSYDSAWMIPAVGLAPPAPRGQAHPVMQLSLD